MALLWLKGCGVRPPLHVVVTSLLLASAMAAQETTGAVRGRVASTATGAIAGATVATTGAHLQGERRTRSASDGIFYLPALPPGRYALRITAIGYRPVTLDSVEVRLGAVTGLGELTLEPTAVDLPPIHVTAPVVTLDPVRTTVGATLTAQDYEVLPAERDYKSALAILPHVNTSYLGDPVNVAGSTGLENMYFVDGVNVTSETNATTSITLPYNFVRAVEVKAGGYEAEYGKALGAVVNAVTYSGTNQLETEVFGFFTSDALQGEPRTLPILEESGAVSYDVGARVSGPVLRDRLWFSTAYNPRIDRVDRKVGALGSYTDRRTAHLFAGKLTWQTSPAVSLTLSIFGDPTTHHIVDTPDFLSFLTPVTVDPLLRLESTGGVVAALRAAATPARWLLLEGGLSYSRTNASNVPDLDTTRSQTSFIDYIDGTIDGWRGFGEVTQGRSTALLRGTAELGRHSLVAGAEYEDARVTTAGGVTRLARSPGEWRLIEEYPSPGTFHNRLPTAYAQNSWRVTDQVTLNAGLRWSAQILTGASGATAQTFPAEWQPRLGFSWQLSRRTKHRVFGSYGRFYQQIPLNFAQVWYVDYLARISSYPDDPRQGNVAPTQVLDFSSAEADWAKQIADIEVENLDEVTVGYEGLFGATRLTVRGMRRDLRSSFQWGVDPESETFWVLGTPGKGDFAFLPPPERTYTALELAAVGAWRNLQCRASYVLSRNWGNYTGLFASDYGDANPGGNATFWAAEQAVNSEGLLPNDRPHVVKLVASYRTAIGLTPGVFLSWMSGTPITEFGTAPIVGIRFISPRGTSGRTPALWDLNVRLAYDVRLRRTAAARVVLDVLHLGNPRETTRVDQFHYQGQDENGDPTINPGYLSPLAYQPPMTVRLGVEISH